MLLYICSMKISVLLIPVLAVCLAGCTKTGPAPSEERAVPVGSDAPGPGGTGGRPAPGEYVLPLVETTDIHGHIVGGSGSGGNGSGIEYSLAYIADKVNDMREGDRNRVLLVDGGDIYQGASVSNLLDGMPVYAALNRMGYDAVTVGNHEFDWDITTLINPDATLPDYEWDGRRCVSEVPVVCANIYQDGSRFSRTDDYVIVEKDGRTIFRDGRWEGDWASRPVILAVSEYLATGERTDYRTGLSNPLPEWNRTSRLLGNSLVDNENAVRVLRSEASSSDGHLYIDTRTHFIAE